MKLSNWSGWIIAAFGMLSQLSLCGLDCAYFHLQKNYLMEDPLLRGVLYTNQCHDIYPQVRVILLDADNNQISEAWLRLEAKGEPFELKLPNRMPEGMYRLVAITEKESEMLTTKDIPVFDSSSKYAQVSDGPGTMNTNTSIKGLTVNWNMERHASEKMLNLTIETDASADDLVSVSVKVTDQAQGYTG